MCWAARGLSAIGMSVILKAFDCHQCQTWPEMFQNNIFNGLKSSASEGRCGAGEGRWDNERHTVCLLGKDLDILFTVEEIMCTASITQHDLNNRYRSCGWTGILFEPPFLICSNKDRHDSLILVYILIGSDQRKTSFPADTLIMCVGGGGADWRGFETNSKHTCESNHCHPDGCSQCDYTC